MKLPALSSGRVKVPGYMIGSGTGYIIQGQSTRIHDRDTGYRVKALGYMIGSDTGSEYQNTC